MPGLTISPPPAASRHVKLASEMRAEQVTAFCRHVCGFPTEAAFRPWKALARTTVAVNGASEVARVKHDHAPLPSKGKTSGAIAQPDHPGHRENFPELRAA